MFKCFVSIFGSSVFLFGTCWSADGLPQPPTIDDIDRLLGDIKGTHICYHFWSTDSGPTLTEDQLNEIAQNRYREKAAQESNQNRPMELNYYTILISDFGFGTITANSNEANKENGKKFWKAIKDCTWVRVKLKTDSLRYVTCYYMTQDAYGKNKPLPNSTFARVVEGKGMLSSNSGYILNSPSVVDRQKILVKLSYRRYLPGNWSWQVDTIHPVHSDELANYEPA